jgi:hypothetical protein
VETSERSTDSETGETRLGDGRVDDPLLAKAVEETLGDLVSVDLLAPSRFSSSATISQWLSAHDRSFFLLIVETNFAIGIAEE